MQRLAVGVLIGGKSIEKEVSLNSGRTICDHLDTAHYDVLPLFQTTDGTLYKLPWRFLHRGKTTDFVQRLPKEAPLITWDELPSLVDFIIPALHGQYAEDGTIQGFLEVLGIPYLGSKVLGSALGMDKAMQRNILKYYNIKTPRTTSLHLAQVIALCEKKHTAENLISHLATSLPVVVKPSMEGSSLGVSWVSHKDELLPAIKKAATINERYQSVIIEEALTGMEFSCVLIYDHMTKKIIPLPATEIVTEQTKIFDYEQKYMPGRALKYTPARCSASLHKKIAETCVATMKALDFRTIVRIDGFLTKDNDVVIIDTNIFPGTAPSSFTFTQAAEIGMTHTALINHCIQSELEAYDMLPDTIKADTLAMHTEKRIRVAVLLGGASNEREISLESGRNVIYKLSPHKYEVFPLFVSPDFKLYHIPQRLLVRNTTQEILHDVTQDMAWDWHSLPEKIDFVFLGLHGGHGENGGVQGTLRMLNIPHNGSPVLPSALCMNKYHTHLVLRSHDIAVPQNVLIKKDEYECFELPKHLALPLIIKPSDDGCSSFVQKVHTKEELLTAAEHIFASGKNEALTEELITGMELTVGVIGNETPYVLPPSQSICQSDVLSLEEKFLPGAGENQTPAPLSDTATALVRDTVKQAYMAAGCKGYARIDCFYQTAEESPTGKERVVIIEINTLPALTPATCLFHQAAEVGIKPMDFIDLLVTLGISYHTQQLETENTTFKALAPALSKRFERCTK